MRRRWLGASLAVGICFAFAACGDEFAAGGDQDALPPITVPDATTGDDGGMDATFGQDTSMGPDVAPAPPDAPGDAPRDGFVSSNEAGADVVEAGPDVLDAGSDVVTLPDVYVAPDACTGETASNADAVFVKQGATGTTCAIGDPCGRFATAFARLGGKTKVYVAEGTYTESFNVPGGITVQGGWSVDGHGAWQRDCVPTAASLTTLHGDGTLAYAVGYAGSGTTTLDTLSIESTGGGGSVSVYGVFVNGQGAGSTVLDLKNVSVTAHDALAGAPGKPGGAGTDGASSCGQSAATCSNGGTGTGGGAGTAAPAGSYGSGGYLPGTGGQASSGNPGSAGTVPPSNETCVFNGGSCGYDGNGVCVLTTGTSCGTQGTCGCGGGGGGGGTGGAGGGSSIAVYVWNATVNVTDGSLAAGNGGAGGAGGAGGSAGSGASGQPGSSGTCLPTACVDVQITPTKDQCEADKTSPCAAGAAGSAGGSGGNGGKGGQGGGGNGGDSYAYFVGGGGAVPSMSAATSVKSGGAAGSPNGATGRSAVHN